MKNFFSFTFLLLIIVAIYAVIRYTDFQPNTKHEVSKVNTQTTMKIISSAFADNQDIPIKYTCNGQNINPPFEFIDVPQITQSLTLIIDDPDAPVGTWIHWVVFNIDPSVREVNENSIPKSGIQGITSSGKASYGGPCPPDGTHHYHFKLFALNKMLSITGTPDNDTVLNEMKDSIIAQAELIGLYSQRK